MPERAVRSPLIVVDAPRVDRSLRLVEGCELMDVQTFVPQATVKRLDERIFHWLAWPNEIELHPTLVRPVFERARHELGAVIDGDGSRWRVRTDGAIQGLSDGVT